MYIQLNETGRIVLVFDPSDIEYTRKLLEHLMEQYKEHGYDVTAVQRIFEEISTAQYNLQ